MLFNQARRVVNGPTFDNAGRIERAVSAANIKIAIGLKFGLFSKGLNLLHLHTQLCRRNQPLVKSADFTLWLIGAEALIDAPEISEDLVHNSGCHRINDLYGDRHAHDDLGFLGHCSSVFQLTASLAQCSGNGLQIGAAG